MKVANEKAKTKQSIDHEKWKKRTQKLESQLSVTQEEQHMLLRFITGREAALHACHADKHHMDFLKGDCDSGTSTNRLEDCNKLTDFFDAKPNAYLLVAKPGKTPRIQQNAIGRLINATSRLKGVNNDRFLLVHSGPF